MSFDDASVILDQAAAAFQSNGSLTTSLRVLAADAPTPHRRKTLEAIVERLERGEPLASILASVEPQLAPLLTATGACRDENLPVILQWASQTLRRRHALNFQLEMALAYPLILLVIGVWLLLASMFMLVPMLAPLVIDFDPPEASGFLLKFCMAGAALGVPYALMVVPLLGMALFALVVIRGLDTIRWRVWFRAVPFVGVLLSDAAMIEFCELLAGLVRARVSLPSAMRLAALGTSDSRLIRGIIEFADDLERGQPSMTACVNAGIPSAVSLFIQEAPSPESLADSLEGLAEVYISRLDVRARALASHIEPMVIVLLVGGFFVLILTVFAPVFRTFRQLL